MGQRSTISLMREQLSHVPPVEKADLSGKVIVIIGANAGIGFETAKHFAAMNPAKLILGCRSQERGAAALEKLKKSTGFERAEVWLIDLLSFSSVKAFADRFDQDVGTLDILVSNAATGDFNYKESEDGWEVSLQANYISHCLLILRLVPSLVKAAREGSASPRVVITSSGLHQEGKVKDHVLNEPSVLRTLSSKQYCTPYDFNERYALTKVLNVFNALFLQEHLSKSTPPIIFNAVDPGFCISELRSAFTGVRAIFFKIMEMIFARTSEEGARQLIWAALANRTNEEVMKGAYISSMVVREPGDFVISDKGKKLKASLWEDSVKILSDVDPKIKPIVEKYFSS